MEARVIRALAASLLLVGIPAGGVAKSIGDDSIVADEKFDRLAADARAMMLAQPQEASKAARRAKIYAESLPSSRESRIMQLTADWLSGEAYNRIGANDSARPIISTALAAISRIAPNSKLHADTLLTQGSIDTAFGDVGRALRDLQSAHTLFRQIGDTRGQAKALSQIAILYYDANDFQASIRYERQAADVIDSDPGIAVSIHNGIGNALKELGRLNEAQAEFERSLALARQMNSPLLVATVLNNLARVALAANRIDLADRSIAESFRQTSGDPGAEFRGQQFELSAELALRRGSIRRAKRLVDDVFAGRDLTRTTLADREGHRTAYEVYRRLEQPSLALPHLAALKRLDDDATTLARSNSAALMAARFDFANQELRIARLKADDLQKTIGFERARSRTQRLIFLGVVGAILAVVGLLLFGLFAIRRSRNEVRSVNAELEAGNAALAKALAVKSEFLAVTSHEIRTPLNGILGMTQVMLADRALPPSVRERVELLQGAGTTMRALVDDILDVAKIEGGKLTIEAIALDLRKLILEAGQLWEAQLAAKSIAFVIDIEAAPDRIMGDPARLRQILFNLLGNAAKFTADGEICLSARCRGEDRYEISVRDSGIGIPLDKQAEIFESFRQGDAGTTRQFGGTGLGLAICRSLARAMGGDVTVVSRPGEGACFTLDLPLVEAGTAEARSRSECEAIYLIIDRNPISRAMHRALLADAVGAIAVAENAAAAFAVLENERVCGVLVDAVTLRAEDDPISTARGIAATVGADKVTLLLGAEGEMEPEIAEIGFACLRKPVARAQLVTHVATQLVAERGTVLVTQAA